MENKQLADTLEMLADLLEFQGANAFRLRAYRNGARVIEDHPEPLAQLVDAGVDLTTLDGIGKSTAEKCVELIETGKLSQLDAILEEVPRSVLDLLRIPNLGPKKAAKLFQELGIHDLTQLKSACEAGKVAELSGFGKKSQQLILDGIEIADAANQRIYWADADSLVCQLREHMQQIDDIDQLEFAGSFRRAKETVGDLDMLVDSADPAAVMDHFANFTGIESTIGRGDTKMSVRLKSGFQIDLRVVPSKSFGAALQYFTGSKEHNVELRSRAKQRSMRVNEWGVFRLDGQRETYVSGATEEEVYRSLDLPWIPPELRENRQEYAAAERGHLPELVELKQIRGDLHMHTTATDGSETIEAMAEAARSRGLEYIAITDHSKRVSMANGLDADRLLEQWQTIDVLNQQFETGFRIFKGIECDILEAGGMDLPDDVLAQADWVLASVHYGQRQTREEITDRILGAIRNPYVSAIAHPTGRLINRREPYAVDLTTVIQAAAEHGTLLELNASPARLDLNDVQLLQAKSAGVQITINTDAHSIKGLDAMRFGLNQARRAGLTSRDIVNCLPLAEFQEFVASRQAAH